jgi:hypothetical protein
MHAKQLSNKSNPTNVVTMRSVEIPAALQLQEVKQVVSNKNSRTDVVGTQHVLTTAQLQLGHVVTTLHDEYIN